VGHFTGNTTVQPLDASLHSIGNMEELTMIRVALYARFSSDNQRDASIEDQLRLCRIYAEKQGWTIVGTYQDRAVSGASLVRAGIQGLLIDALHGQFDIVLSEALDRISRDQEDVAGVFKRMAFAEVKIVTLSEGEITHLHVGLKGTMNALFLKDLADKTRRGLRGRVEVGKSGGGLCYGYEVVKQTNAAGEPICGSRRIVPEAAEIVRRIFREFTSGLSPRRIAIGLNKDGVPGPGGKLWGDTTIRGHVSRGTGVLNNELYAGRLVWNRQRYIRDPSTGKRVSRPNLTTGSRWMCPN
jgi:site-specific DNA recombinase